MIGVSKLLGAKDKFGDKLRYSKKSKNQKHGTREDSGPVVVWNMTRTCNLKCTHCYSDSDYKNYGGELSTTEAKEFIDDLADFPRFARLSKLFISFLSKVSFLSYLRKYLLIHSHHLSSYGLK